MIISSGEVGFFFAVEPATSSLGSSNSPEKDVFFPQSE